MSHFTKCELKLTNLAALKNALDDLNLEYQEAQANQAVHVRGWRGATVDAALSVNMGKYDVGVVMNEDGTYDMVADWWGVEVTKGLSQEEFTQQVNQRYQYNNVRQACESKGYTLEEEEVEEDGTVKLYVRRWVQD